MLPPDAFGVIIPPKAFLSGIASGVLSIDADIDSVVGILEAAGFLGGNHEFDLL